MHTYTTMSSPQPFMHAYTVFIVCDIIYIYIYIYIYIHAYIQVERYDPGKDTWERVSPMSKQRSAFAACTANGSIYAVGGSDGLMSLRSVERYDPRNDK